MKANVVSVRRVKDSHLPPGDYNGLWSGYTVVLKQEYGERYELQTSDGVRGIDIPCRVKVSGTGLTTVETK